jgi:hypothetical protein
MSISERPFSVKIFLANGIAEGLRIIEKDNWNGSGVVCPRNILKNSSSRMEFHQPGVYILIGESEGRQLPIVYIGEADPVGKRLNQHNSEKDFWTQAIFFIGKLHKAHIQYLESKLLLLAKNAKRCILENGNQPTLPTLSEAEIAFSEGFLEEMLLCLRVLGVDAFEQPIIHSVQSVEESVQPLFSQEIMTIKSKGIIASGYVSVDGFVVRKDSGAVKEKELTPHLTQSNLGFRKELIDSGVLLEIEDKIVFSQDYEFSSPSSAARMILGASANGRKEWKNSNGKSLNDLSKLNK